MFNALESRHFFTLPPVPSMPAAEMSDLHRPAVCFSTVFPQVRFAHPRPRQTKTDQLADVGHLLPLQSLIKLLAPIALEE